MQLKKVTALCALALASLAGSAQAAVDSAHATLIQNAIDGERVVFISGASAVQKGFTSAMASLLNSPIYLADAQKDVSGSDVKYIAVAGTLKAAAGSWAANSPVVLVYRLEGGSVWGVNPVARGTLIKSLNVAPAGCGQASGSETGGTGTAKDPYKCPTNTRKPDAGISDVAPALFKSPINTEGELAEPELSQAELDELVIKQPIYGLSFGIPVTNNVGNVKFSRSMVSAIMSGGVGTWDQVGDAAGGDVVICRRVPGSGTQAVMNLWAGNYPCNSDYNTPADRNYSGAWDEAARKFTVNANTGGVVVIENSSSGDVKKCLDAAVAGTNYSTKDRSGAAVTVEFNGTGHKAIGVLSMDSLGDSKATGNWQFRALGGDGDGRITATVDADKKITAVNTTGTGLLPTEAAYENGDWDLQGWVSFNVPSRTTGAKKALLDAFVAKVSDPTEIDKINSLKYVAMAIPGQEAPFEFTGPKVLDAAYLNNNQCAPYNRIYND